MEKLNIFLRKSFEPVLFFFPCPSVSILHLALVLLPDEFRLFLFFFSHPATYRVRFMFQDALACDTSWTAVVVVAAVTEQQGTL